MARRTKDGRKQAKTKTLAIAGLWHLGSVYSACFAELGFNVIGIDEDEKVVEALNRGRPPVAEPGLAEMISRNLKRGNLSFTSVYSKTQQCDFDFIALDTPVDKEDKSNLDPIFEIARKLKPNVASSAHVIISSQVPVGTCSRISEIMGLDTSISYVPENLVLGKALESFMHPSRIVVGSDSERERNLVSKLFQKLRCEVIQIGLRSAEMVKHVLNTYLALCVSFGNEIGSICRSLDIDAQEAILVVMKDPRVSPSAPMRPGLPFSGGTLGRDLESLLELGKKLDQKTYLLDAIALANENRKKTIVAEIEKSLDGNLNRTIAFLGLTYKAGTGTLRRSFALEVAETLHNNGVTIQAYDPAVDDVRNGAIDELAKSAYGAARGADIAVVFTGWPEFRNLDYKKIRSELKQPIVIDLPCVIDEKKAKSAGLKIVGV